MDQQCPKMESTDIDQATKMTRPRSKVVSYSEYIDFQTREK
jgi:hypothetical protein